MKLMVIYFLSAIVLFTVSDVTAQTDTPENQKTPFQEEARARFNSGEVREDFLVPTSPGFAVLGIAPQEVIRPDTPRTLGAAFLNGVDPNGNIQSGVAIDFAPYYLFRGRYLKLEDYRSNYLTRLVSRVQVSLATIKNDNDGLFHLALGLRLALLDKADPRNSEYLDNCYNVASNEKLDELKKRRAEAASILAHLARVEDDIRTERSKGNTDRVQELLIELTSLTLKREAALGKVTVIEADAEKFLEEIWSNCNKEFEKEHWNASNFTIGIAPIFSSREGNFKDLEASGAAFYGSLAYDFNTKIHQTILHVRYRTNEEIANPDLPDGFIEQDSILVGMQFRFAGPDIGNIAGGRDLVFFGEVDYQGNRSDENNSKSRRLALGIDYKLANNSTVSLTVGDETGDEIGASGAFAVGDLKVSF